MHTFEPDCCISMPAVWSLRRSGMTEASAFKQNAKKGDSTWVASSYSPQVANESIWMAFEIAGSRNTPSQSGLHSRC